MASSAVKDYELRRGNILVLSASQGRLRCAKCGAEWTANIRPNSGGLYHRGAWTCYVCGANSKRVQ